MLIIAGTINIDPSDAEVLASAATTMMEATMAEPGCREYVFSISVADPSNVQIFEVWDSGEDLAAHFEMPHMTEFRAVLDTVSITGRSINRYEVASSEPM